jgi:hypothetical protein
VWGAGESDVSEDRGGAIVRVGCLARQIITPHQVPQPNLEDERRALPTQGRATGTRPRSGFLRFAQDDAKRANRRLCR